MNYYQEITLLPDAEIPLHFLWTRVFTQLHLALADYQRKTDDYQIGLAFPEYQEGSLGKKIHIFAKKDEALTLLNLQDKWLSRLADYIHLTSIRRVPLRRIKGYVIYSRYQPDSSIWRKAKRYAKRHQVSYTEASELLQRKKDQQLPYIQMKSLTNGQKFSLFIKEDKVETENKGTFTTYGLSQTATVPIL